MGLGFVSEMGEESGVWWVSDFDTHSEDLGVMKVCAVSVADPFCLAWVACVFGCYTIGILGRVSICHVVFNGLIYTLMYAHNRMPNM
jgi:hypothetical protein